MFKIALNAGHYLYESGKRCMKALDPNETREWVLNSRIAEKVEKKLLEYEGYALLRIDDRTGETEVSLSNRASAANLFGADIYISLHHNAGVGGGTGGGIMVYIHPNSMLKTVEWQSALYDALIRHTGLKGNRSTPLAKSNFKELRETNMSAVLLELGFMDSATDVPVILSEEYANACAAAIVEVLINKGGLTRKSVIEEVPKIEEVPNKSEEESVKKLYRVRKTWEDIKSQVGAYRTLKNAIVKAKQTECNVYDSDGKIVWEYVEFVESSTPPIEEAPEEPQDNIQEVAKDNPQEEAKVNAIVDIILKVLKKITEIFLNYFKKE